MLDAGKYAAPVAAVQSFINNSVNLDIDSLAADYPVVDAAKEIQQPALVEDAWVRRRRRTGFVCRVVEPPCFGFVHRGSPGTCQHYIPEAVFREHVSRRTAR